MNLELFPAPELSPLHFENLARRQGFRAVAGVDEAGRGPLAGPVVAAAVILPERFNLPGLNDSKQLSPKERQRFFLAIRQSAAAIGLGIVSADRIDVINILQATLQAMSLAVRRLKISPDYLLVDGISAIPLPLRQMALKQGDSRSWSIAAASVIAKVVRDRMMAGYDRSFPGYGFAAHKGYGCASHMEAIARLGPSPLHRRTFSGVKEHVKLS
jgi:ribonuclease HII